MRLILVCPVCSEALTVERLPGPAACPKCFQPFPAAAREAVARELQSPPAPEEGRVRRPFLLTAWMGVSALNVVQLCLFLVMSVVVPGPINGVQLSGAGFVLRFFLPLLGATVVTAAAVYGIWTERPWTRRAVLASWLSFAAFVALLTFVRHDGPAGVKYPVSFTVAALASRLFGVLLPLLGFAVSAWYLYRKPNVVAYFDAIERGRTRS